MNRKLRRKFKMAGAAALTMTMVTSLGLSALMASADSTDGSGFRRWTSEYGSFDEVLHKGEEVNEQLAAEGFVLLKNRNSALPLGASERNVTLLGAESYQTITGGGGSGTTNRPGSGNHSWVSSTASSLESSLTSEGFSINNDVKELHRSGSGNRVTYGAGANGDRNTYMTVLAEGNGVVEFGGEQYNVPATDFYASATSTFSTYGDAAIINISRTGAEATDNAAHGAAGHADTNAHYLQLNDSERQILAYAKYQKTRGEFKKIIIVVNSPSVMELGDIEDDDAFDAMLWVGVTGWNGADAIGKVLTGEYNPSGRTVDFWMRDFTTDPTWYGFGGYGQAAYILNNGEGDDPYRVNDINYGAGFDMGAATDASYKAPSMILNEESILTNTANAVTYSEGIFLGYRYYETVAADIGGTAGEEWYAANTLYPFGYGLSYTSFTQEITSVDGNLSSANGEITVNVRVTNTGSVEGKDVVQIYNTPEYTDGEIDKAEVNLVGFAKTKVLGAGESETVKVTFDVKELASFDYNDANYNNFEGYELEAGNYELTLRNNSHEVLDRHSLSASNLLTWDEDGNPATPNNIFSQEDGEWEMFNTSASHWTTSGRDHDLHRDTLVNDDGNGPADLTDLAWMLTEDNNFKEEAFRVLQMRESQDVNQDFKNHVTGESDYTNVWTKTAGDMAGLTQGTGVVGENGMYALNIGDMSGLDYNDPMWDEFMNQLTWDEIQSLINDGDYYTVGLSTIGKPQLHDSDGPGQLGNNAQGSFSSYHGWAWVCEVVIASTWNTELAYEQGQTVGEETLWNPGSAEGGIAWYGPAMNTHRNPLEGRTFEYYSQDGLHGGKIAAAVVKGATDKGARVYIKHAMLNDQETSRVDNCALINEQALRQIYAKQFELAVKEGNANGIMTSFNSIGLAPSTSYAIGVQLYSNEWGYKGINVTDFWMATRATGWNGYNMPRGLSFPLAGFTFGQGLNAAYRVNSTWDADENVVKVNGEASYTQWYWSRETAKRLLYVHANSNGGRNGLINSLVFTDNEITGIAGDPIESVKIVDVDYLNKVYGEGNFEVTGLPEGLTFNAATGTVSGTPTTPTNSITLTVAGINGYEWTSVSASLGVIYRKADLSGATGANVNKATIGEEYSATAAFPGLVAEGEGQNYWATGSASADTYNDGNGFVGAVTYSAEGLPAGLTIDPATGVISGTPSVGYTVNHVTVIATVNQVLRVPGQYAQWGGPEFEYRTQSVEARVNYDIALTGARTLDIVSDGTTVLSLAAGSQAITLGDISFIGQDITDMNLTAPVEGALPGGLMLADGTLLDMSDMNTQIASTVDKLYLAWTLPPAGIIDGNWWINGEDTGIPSTGIPTPEPPAPITPENPADNAGGISAGAAAGIGIGCFAVGAGALGLAMFILLKKRKQG